MATPSDYDGKGPPHEAAKGYGKMALFLIHLAMISVGIIGVATITQITHARNKISNIQGRSRNAIKVIFHIIMNCSQRKEFAPSGSKFFPLREVPILKRDAIGENHCLILLSPFDVRNFFSVLATPLGIALIADTHPLPTSPQNTNPALIYC